MKRIENFKSDKIANESLILAYCVIKELSNNSLAKLPSFLFKFSSNKNQYSKFKKFIRGFFN